MSNYDLDENVVRARDYWKIKCPDCNKFYDYALFHSCPYCR